MNLDCEMTEALQRRSIRRKETSKFRNVHMLSLLQMVKYDIRCRQMGVILGSYHPDRYQVDVDFMLLAKVQKFSSLARAKVSFAD